LALLLLLAPLVLLLLALLVLLLLALLVLLRGVPLLLRLLLAWHPPPPSHPGRCCSLAS
jgi:hypothetical protein